MGSGTAWCPLDAECIPWTCWVWHGVGSAGPASTCRELLMPFLLGDVNSAARAAVVTGDPERVELLAKVADSVTNTWRLPRGYVCAEVVHNDIPVLMCSTG